MTICIACWIPKATNTHLEYVILLFHCSSGCTNVHHYNVIHTLRVLLPLHWLRMNNAKLKEMITKCIRNSDWKYSCIRCINLFHADFNSQRHNAGLIPWPWARGSTLDWGTALQTGRSRVRFPMVSLEFFYWNNPTGRTVALVLTQPVT
jgi:hypothetical protein